MHCCETISCVTHGVTSHHCVIKGQVICQLIALCKGIASGAKPKPWEDMKTKEGIDIGHAEWVRNFYIIVPFCNHQRTSNRTHAFTLQLSLSLSLSPPPRLSLTNSLSVPTSHPPLVVPLFVLASVCVYNCIKESWSQGIQVTHSPF
jgi:hypothetical protein